MFYTPFLFTSLSNRINTYQYLFLGVSALSLSGANTEVAWLTQLTRALLLRLREQSCSAEKLSKAFQNRYRLNVGGGSRKKISPEKLDSKCLSLNANVPSNLVSGKATAKTTAFSISNSHWKCKSQSHETSQQDCLQLLAQLNNLGYRALQISPG